MKKISLENLECINGGGNEVLDWACAGVGVGRVGVYAAARLGLQIVLGPVGSAIAIGCTAYGVGKVFQWW